MKLTIQNGTQEPISPDVVKSIIANESGYFEKKGLTLSAITMFLNFYDQKGAPVQTEPSTSYYLRSEKYIRERAGYEYIGKYNAGEKIMYLYRTDE